MKKSDLKKLEQKRQQCEEAKQALFLEAGYPCRGHIYSYQRGNNTYFKWELREAGKRIQKTIGIKKMEALHSGIVERKRFEEYLQEYYSACEEYVFAKVQIDMSEQNAKNSKKKLD